MKAEELYKEAYRLLEEVTPLKADCGQACGKACCDGDEDTGMYLFPGEECMYKKLPVNFRIEKTDFCCGEGKNALILLCDPPCDRGLRPLACRIFPLLPYIDVYGNMKIIMDPRGRSICPLVRCVEPEDLSTDFYERTGRIFKVLIRSEEIYEFLFELSRQIDEIFTDFKNLFLTRE